MSMISGFRAARDTVYNKVWHTPKGKFSARLRKVCDDLPHGKRVTVVGVMLTVFVLIAFFVFGHACYRIGLGQALRRIEVRHIQPLDLPVHKVEPLTSTVYDNAGMESED